MDKTGPLVSIIMCAYNEEERHLRQAVESILDQTMTDFEFIIVMDDPNNENLIGILREYETKDKRIRIIINDTNMGHAISMDRAIRASCAEYIMKMDADDISMPERMKEQLEYIQKYNYDAVFSHRINIDENDIESKNKAINYKNDDIEKILPEFCMLVHPTLFIKRDVYYAAEGYRDFKCAQDYDLWLRLLDAGYKIGIVDKPLIKYRLRESSISGLQPIKQRLTARYIKSLHRERKRAGTDSYSAESYNRFLYKNGYGNEKKQKKIEKHYEYNRLATSRRKNKQYFSSLYYSVRSILFSKYFVILYLEKIKNKIMTRKY